MSGAMGGSESEEFLAPTPVGEDTFVGCTQCGYAANTEAVPSPAPRGRADRRAGTGRGAGHPGHPAIDSLVDAGATRDAGRPGDWTAATR